MQSTADSGQTHQGLRESLFSRMALIRHFETRLFHLFDQGALSGTTHCCIGQEAIAVAIAQHLRPHDIIVSNH